MPILGIIRDYRTRGGVVYCSLSFFERATADSRWTGAIIFLNDRGAGLDRRIAGLRNRILLSAAQRGESIEASAGADLRHDILQIFDETFAVTTALLFISLVISALGVATTLTILVLERARQFQTMIVARRERRPGKGRNRLGSRRTWFCSVRRWALRAALFYRCF